MAVALEAAVAVEVTVKETDERRGVAPAANARRHMQRTFRLSRVVRTEGETRNVVQKRIEAKKRQLDIAILLVQVRHSEPCATNARARSQERALSKEGSLARGRER